LLSLYLSTTCGRTVVPGPTVPRSSETPDPPVKAAESLPGLLRDVPGEPRPSGAPGPPRVAPPPRRRSPGLRRLHPPVVRRGRPDGVPAFRLQEGQGRRGLGHDRPVDSTTTGWPPRALPGRPGKSLRPARSRANRRDYPPAHTASASHRQRPGPDRPGPRGPRRAAEVSPDAGHEPRIGSATGGRVRASRRPETCRPAPRRKTRRPIARPTVYRSWGRSRDHPPITAPRRVSVQEPPLPRPGGRHCPRSRGPGVSRNPGEDRLESMSPARRPTFAILRPGRHVLGHDLRQARRKSRRSQEL
jgi:hypothetical protein